MGLQAIHDVPVVSNVSWRPRNTWGYRIVRVQQSSSDWGSSEFGSAATAGGAITTAGLAIAALSTNTAAAAAIGAGVLLGGGLLVAGVGLVILTYSAVKLIQIANGKFQRQQGGGAPREPKIGYIRPNN
jgi:hypothetical protein